MDIICVVGWSPKSLRIDRLTPKRVIDVEKRKNCKLFIPATFSLVRLIRKGFERDLRREEGTR